MPPVKSLREHLDYIRAHREDFGSLLNTIDDMLETPEVSQSLKERLPGIREALQDDLKNNRMDEAGFARDMIVRELEIILGDAAPLRRAPRVEAPAPGVPASGAPVRIGGRRTQSKKFGSCVKAVRKTVKARKGSNPESAAIAICTKSMLFPRGRTIKRYKKGRLTTQKRRI